MRAGNLKTWERKMAQALFLPSSVLKADDPRAAMANHGLSLTYHWRLRDITCICEEMGKKVKAKGPCEVPLTPPPSKK